MTMQRLQSRNAPTRETIYAHRRSQTLGSVSETLGLITLEGIMTLSSISSLNPPLLKAIRSVCTDFDKRVNRV